MGKSSKTRSFLIFWIKKNAVKTRKRKFLKKTKNRNFPKELDHSFIQNIELFIICVFLCKSSHKRSFFGLLDKKECFLGQKKEVLKNSSKSKFSKRVCPWILSKIELFIMYYVFFWANQARKDYFLVFWIKKNPFWTRKRKF